MHLLRWAWCRLTHDDTLSLTDCEMRPSGARVETTLRWCGTCGLEK